MGALEGLTDELLDFEAIDSFADKVCDLVNAGRCCRGRSVGRLCCHEFKYKREECLNYD